MEYLGRTDHQVKVRGFRIELGEVEAALREHGGVGEAVVVVREDEPGERRLVAYVAPAAGVELRALDLKTKLRERLPEHMVPGAFVRLERLPLNANGKMDRAALPAPERLAGEAYVASRTGVEEVLAGIWAEVLGIARVGAHDDFFALGGHSLLATQVVARVRRVFGIELPLRTLFEAPTLAALAGRIDVLRGAGTSQAPPLVRVPRTEALPLSFAQQRLWVVDRLEPDSPAYNMPAALRLRGAPDLPTLRASLDALVARHETLRTVFAERDGRPVQVIHPPAPVPLPLLDLRGLPAGAREEEARRLSGAEAMRPFDLERGPLLRGTLLRLAEDDHVLLFTLHHVVSDGWSMQVLVREVSALYGAFSGGEEPRLAELPIQYADYAVWQRQWLSGEVLEEQIGYWKDALAGAPPLLEIPTDHSRVAGQSARARSHPFALSAEVSRGLRGVSRQEGTTLFMTLLAGWTELLGRWAGQEDVVVGTPIAGRTQQETEGLIGFFVNMLALRVELSGDPTWTELLGRVREATLGAYEHQELPFERLIDELSVERSLTHSPVFQATLALERKGEGDERLRLGDLSVEPFGRGGGAAKFELELVFADVGEALGGTLIYRPTLFEAGTIARLMGHLEAVLEALAADPGRRSSEVSLLRGAERAQVLEAWNATAVEYPRILLHDLVSAQAARTPRAVAVVFEDQSLTYAELEARANRLAHHLRHLGVGPESRVGVCAERSPELVVALLGVLKAGGAYVPLDPSYPAERLAYMLGDSGVPVLLTQERLLERLPAHSAQVLRLDADAALWEGRASEPPAVQVEPESLAYVIYTSGSTGRPKGAMNAHRGIVNRLLWMQQEYGLDESDVVLQKTPFSFDVSVWEFFWPLLTGARLVLARPEGHRDPAYLSELIEREGVSTLHFVPPMLQAFLDAGEPARCGTLRRVVCSGEALPYELTERFREALPGVELHNLYGPTEAAVDVTYWSCGPNAGRRVPIGRPVANTRVYVLDGAGEPVPVGVSGELYIGGVQVGRGYLGRAELTAERFVPDAFSSEAGGRLYRTGDRARWTGEGEVEYLGRTDFQVKVRGFRIELGEVEAALREHPRVGETVVLAREDAPGDRRLVAYVVPPAGGEAGAAELRAYLHERLPEHMVPGAIMVLESIPLTANGKVDRRALPAPERVVAGEDYVAPRTAVEEILCEVLAGVLKLERVGVAENFFEVGGDSILAIQVVSRARRRGLKLVPRQLFERPTIARLAEVAERVDAGTDEAPQGPVTGEAPLMPFQQRFLEGSHPNRSHFNQGLLLRPREALEAGRLARVAAALETHHDALRLRFRQAEDGTWRQAHAAAGEHRLLTVFDLSGVPAEARHGAVEATAEQVQRSLDIGSGPLLRMGYFALGADDPGRLLVVIHHLAVDGVSWRVLLEDLESAYTQLSRGEEVRLPAKTTSWRAWAERLAEHARSGALAGEAAYWAARAALEVQPLPVDDAGAQNTVSAARGVAVRLSEAETQALLREVPQAYRTQIDEVLLCALAGALARWTGERRVRIDLEGHGREEETVGGVDLSRTVGWFTSLYPVVLELPEGGGVGAALKATKEQLRSVPGKGIGYGLLRYVARSEAGAGLARAPEAEVVFNYLGQVDQAVSAETFFGFAPESAGAMTDPGSLRSHRLEVTGTVRAGRLELRIGYAEGVHRRETMERLAEGYAGELRAILAHCASEEAGGYTPSDFPLAGLEQAALDALLGSGRGVEDVYPLTPLQEGILFLTLYAPGSGVYVDQSGYVLEGPLDAAALERAWRGVVARHEALRAGFAWEGLPRPVQVIRREAAPRFRVEDWRGLDEAERQARLERYLAEDRTAGFDPGEAPLMRLALFRTGEREHQLVWTHHHLIVDGWSIPLILAEVMAQYAAHLRGEAPRPAGGRRYRDYVAWLERQDRARAERFWREALAGFHAPTPLPAARPAGDAGGEPGHGKARLRLSAERTGALREQARGWGVTTSTLVQGAWAVLLGRYADEDDVVFGATVSGRPAELSGVEDTVGMFINTLPVRVRLQGAAQVGEWLAGLQRGQVEAREYEYAPLVAVQGWSQVPGGGSLFESLVVLRNFPVDQAITEAAGDVSGLRVRGNLTRDQSNYPLVLEAHAGARITGEIRYELGRFEAGAVERMVGQLQVLLEDMAADPARRLWELSLLGGSERTQLLEEWNGTEVAYPRAAFHEMFAEQAARTPQVAATTFGDEVLTYAELEARSNRLANHLRRRGVGPETRVGLCLERGVELLVGVLGVLKAGGAYVPLDPAYPADRLAFMLADSGAPVLLTRLPLPEGLSAYSGEVVCLDRERECIEAESARVPAAGVALRNPAYVIYTSGSTGRPKGVVVEHGSLAHFAATMRQTFALHTGEVALGMASIAFDIWVFEALVPLVCGATVRVLPLEQVKDGAAVAEELRTTGTFNAVPTLMRQIVSGARELEPGALAGVRWVHSGGEAVTPELWADMREVFPCARLCVLYGPTEATVLATSYTVPEPVPAGGLTIGRPLPNVRIYVLDAHAQPVPAGVPGELWIGGAGVARGYLGRADLTAERFVPDAFGSEAGARAYRSGDRVRWRADGELEFLGRIDAQVKIRGHRVELGEVEAVLAWHPGVRQAAATVRDDVSGQKVLQAFVVPAEGAEEVSAAELREYVSARLPGYMVPATFVLLDELPLNANGKVDRRALPQADPKPDAAYVAPRTAGEELLSGIWAEVLGVEGVGVEDSFFELGGQSLMAMQVVSRVREAFGVEVPLEALFEDLTVAALARRVEELRGAGTSQAPPLVRVSRDGPPPLSFGQQRLWVVDRLEPDSPTYNMPAALRLRGAPDVAALRASLDALVARHEALRTVFAESEGGPVQVIHPPAPVPLPLLDLRGLPAAAAEEEARRRASAEALHPFDLERGPLLRSTLLRLAEDDHVLLFTLHHVVSDGWSMQVLVREVSALYASFNRGEEPRLAELPIQYADYAVWQREWLSGEALEEQIGYWKAALAGAPPLLEIPTDRPRVAGQSARARSHPFALSVEVSRGLRALSRQEGTTLFMTLLAGWTELLGRWAGQEDVVVGSPIAGRTRRETEGLIGFFVNMLALRIDLSGDSTWTELLGRVREGTLGAYEHQELPFERLIEELSVERSLTHSPVFQSTFALEQAGGGEQRLRLGGLALEAFGRGAQSAKFEMELTFADAGEALVGALLYRTALFEAETVARLTGHLEAVLEAMVADPGRRSSEVSLLRGAERAQVLEAGNATAADFPHTCLHDLVSARAARAPGAVAVAFEGQSLTYAELESRANQLAHHLRDLGVGPESRVGVCAERSLELIVALLGVLKAGGAYVPLDPAYPAERLAYMLEDSGVSVLLSQERLLERLPAHSAQLLCLDRDAALWEGRASEPPAVRVEPESLAYVIYTSGSTGRPKGVAVTHANVTRLFHATDAWFGFGEADVWTLFHSYAFDFSVWEIWGALLYGGRLVVVPWETSRSPEEFYALLVRERVTVLSQTPSAFRQLDRVEETRGVSPGLALRLVVFGGEALELGSLRGWLDRHGEEEPRLVNMYGITETTVHVTYRPIGRADVEAGAGSVVGTAIPDLGVRVLDRRGHPVPVGVAGELYVGGAGVARGYLGRPELTAERFVPDAYGSGSGERLYRSGDRVRWLASGELEYLGRIDTQVKIRGFRIEPGEVESVLAGLPEVREAAVTVREDTPGEKRLVAYVVARDGAELSTRDLRAQLSMQLPEHMVPGAVVVLERLPLNANGKVDRRALPAPERTMSEGAEYVAPRTVVEEVLAGIWAEVLGVERVGVEDNFFELGGHSLLATQVASSVQRTFGVKVPLRNLFETPTIAALAGAVEDQMFLSMDDSELAESLMGPGGVPELE